MQARIEALAPITPRRRGLRIGLGTAAAAILAVAACMVPDPLSPEVSERIAKAAATANESPSVASWARAHLEGMGPAQVVILVRSSTGALLGRERLVRTAPGGRPERVGGGQGILEEVRTSAIESVEVIKGGLVIDFTGIEGVIVVTLKAGEQLGKPVTDEISPPDARFSLRHLVYIPNGVSRLHLAGGSFATESGRRYTRR